MNPLGALFIAAICVFFLGVLGSHSPIAAVSLVILGGGLTGWALVGRD